MKERELLNSSTIVFQQIRTSERLGLFRCPPPPPEFARQKSKMPDNHSIIRHFLYPDPGSNRDGFYSTGVWDQRVYRFRHLGFCGAKLYKLFVLCKFLIIFLSLLRSTPRLKQTGVGRVVGNHHRQRDADKSTCRQGKATERFGNISNKNRRFLLISPIFYQISI